MNKKHYILERCYIIIITIVYFCLPALDSSGELKSGFLYGNNFWLGSRSQCLDIMNKTPIEFARQYMLNNTRYRDPQDEFPPFQLNYFVAYIRHNSTLQYHINMFDEVISFFLLRLSRLSRVYHIFNQRFLIIDFKFLFQVQFFYIICQVILNRTFHATFYITI